MMSSAFSITFVLFLAAVVLPLQVQSTHVTQVTSRTQLSSTAVRQRSVCNGTCFRRERMADRQCSRVLRRGNDCIIGRCPRSGPTGFFCVPVMAPCTGLCFVRRARANTQCERFRNRGGQCEVVDCIRTGDAEEGFLCRVISPIPDAPAPAPRPVPAPPVTTFSTVTPPTVGVVTPVTIIAVATTTATPSVTPSVSPSVTPSPSPSPSVTVTPSMTPTNSVSPTPSPSCVFTLAGDLGMVAIGGTCRCGTDIAQVTVLNGVSNNGLAIPNGNGNQMDRQNESLTCYINCLNDLLAGLACDPDSFHVFSSDGQAIVESCCTNCANTLNGDPGDGVNRPTNQCFLADP